MEPSLHDGTPYGRHLRNLVLSLLGSVSSSRCSRQAQPGNVAIPLGIPVRGRLRIGMASCLCLLESPYSGNRPDGETALSFSSVEITMIDHGSDDIF